VRAETCDACERSCAAEQRYSKIQEERRSKTNLAKIKAAKKLGLFKTVGGSSKGVGGKGKVLPAGGGGLCALTRRISDQAMLAENAQVAPTSDTPCPAAAGLCAFSRRIADQAALDDKAQAAATAGTPCPAGGLGALTRTLTAGSAPAQTESVTATLSPSPSSGLARAPTLPRMPGPASPSTPHRSRTSVGDEDELRGKVEM
jgi:hypothetical protein